MISNKILLKRKKEAPKHTGSIQGRANQERKLTKILRELNDNIKAKRICRIITVLVKMGEHLSTKASCKLGAKRKRALDWSEAHI